MALLFRRTPLLYTQMRVYSKPEKYYDDKLESVENLFKAMNKRYKIENHVNSAFEETAAFIKFGALIIAGGVFIPLAMSGYSIYCGEDEKN